MKVLVVGCGSIGSRHARNLTALGASPVGVDPDSAHRDAFVAAIPGAAAYPTIEAALEQHPDSTAAVVASPSHLHVRQAHTLVTAGKAVLIEKPLADRLEGVEDLKAAARERGVAVMMAMCYRFHSGLRKVKALLEEGAIGRPVVAWCGGGHYLPDWHPQSDYRLEYAARRSMGGGVLLTSVHTVDYARWLFGEWVEVSATLDKVSELEIDVEDLALLQARTDRGVHLQIRLDFVSRAPEHRIEVVGSHGNLHWSMAEREVRLFRNGRWEAHPYAFEINDMYLREMASFLACVQSGQDPEAPLQEGVADLKLVEAIRSAALLRRSVKVGDEGKVSAPGGLSSKTVAVRVDADARRGLGHLGRALSVGEALRARGARVVFSTEGGLAADRAHRAGFEVVLKGGDSEEDLARRLALEFQVDAIVVDHKEVAVAEVRAAGVPVVQVDPPPAAVGEADLAVVPTAHSDPEVLQRPWNQGDRRLYLGPEYVIVRPEIRSERAAVSAKDRTRGTTPLVTVTTGGADPEGVLLRLLPGLALLPESACRLSILVGAAFARLADLDTRLAAFPRQVDVCRDDAFFPEILAVADLAVCTFGVTPYELAYLGVPAILVSHSEENARGAARFSQHGTAVDLGRAEDVSPESLAERVGALLADGGQRDRMREAGRLLVDGMGSERIGLLVAAEIEGRGT